MSNVSAPMGFVPSRKLGGGCLVTNPYTIASGYNTNLFSGDPVVMTGTGKNIALAAAGETGAVGVFAGCKFIDAEGRPQFKPYWPANTVLAAGTECEALVYDDPDIIFKIQADTVAAADVGALCDWVAGTGSVITGQSGAQAEASATAATGKSLRILGKLPEVGNEYGQYGKVEVLFVEHALRGVVAGVGGD